MKQLKRAVIKQIGRVTRQEFLEVFPLAKRKYERIKSRERRELGTWYLVVLIGEAISQSRLTRFCIMDFYMKKAAHIVGEQG